jgi:hypothetical protein
VKPHTAKPRPVAVPDVSPFEDWSYCGTIRQGRTITALLENTRTHEGEFVKAGDRFMGAAVRGVTGQAVTLASGGKTRMIAKSDRITVTQLSKDAVPATPPAPKQPRAAPQPAPAAPAQPAVPARTPGTQSTIPGGPGQWDGSYRARRAFGGPFGGPMGVPFIPFGLPPRRN